MMNMTDISAAKISSVKRVTRFISADASNADSMQVNNAVHSPCHTLAGRNSTLNFWHML